MSGDKKQIADVNCLHFAHNFLPEAVYFLPIFFFNFYRRNFYILDQILFKAKKVCLEPRS